MSTALGAINSCVSDHVRIAQDASSQRQIRLSRTISCVGDAALHQVFVGRLAIGATRLHKGSANSARGAARLVADTLKSSWARRASGLSVVRAHSRFYVSQKTLGRGPPGDESIVEVAKANPTDGILLFAALTSREWDETETRKRVQCVMQEYGLLPRIPQVRR